MTTSSAAAPSTLEISSGDEDLVEPASTPELSKFLTDQLLHFMQQERGRRSDPDFGKALYHPTVPHEIRVLKISPGDHEEPLVANLEHINVNFDYVADEKGWRRPADFGLSFSKRKKVPYTAVSYCWGSGDFTCPIEVSGHAKMITSTLDEILRHLRDEKRSVTVWVDQLCIDQSSNADKASQVQLMGLVYTRARNTVIWLGKEPGREAFTYLQKLSRDTMGREELLDDELDQLRSPAREDAEGMRSLRALLQQPWFQRTWIIQEAVLSPDSYFMAGHDTTSWEQFAGDCQNIAGLGILDGDDKIHGNKSTLAVLKALYNAKSYNDTHQLGQGVFFWLVDTRYADVTQAVDKVYGILGLCESDIVPDYSKPAEQLYSEVAQQILHARVKPIEDDGFGTPINLHSVTRFLCCVDHDTDPASTKLPSWVPDWSKPRMTTSLAYTTACLSYYEPGEILGRKTFSLSDMTLSVNAALAGEVMEISDTCLETELTLNASPTSNASLRQCIDFFNHFLLENSDKQSHYQGPDFWSIFCSTMVAGKDHTGFSKSPKEYIETLSFLCDLVSARKPTFPGQTYSARQDKPISTLR